MGAETDAVGVADAHAGGGDVVGEPGELVDARHLDRAAGAQPGASGLEALDRARAVVGPHDIAQLAEEAVEVDRVGLDEAVGEQVEAQVGVGGALGGRVEVDGDGDDLGAHAAGGVLARERHELLGDLCGFGGLAERRLGVPGVEDGALGRHGGHAVAPGCARRRHGPDLTKRPPAPTNP